MRKVRDYDAELKALGDKARAIKAKRIEQLGQLVAATGADALDAETLAGVLLDAGTQGNHIASQRMIYTLPADIRSRLNALYLAIFFFGGAAGSAVSGFAVARGGAAMVCAIGFAIGAVAMTAFAIELMRRR